MPHVPFGWADRYEDDAPDATAHAVLTGAETDVLEEAERALTAGVACESARKDNEESNTVDKNDGDILSVTRVRGFQRQ